MMKEYSLPKHNLSEEQKNTADEALRLYRFKRLQQMTDSAKIYAELLRLKYNMKDYLDLNVWDEAHSFGHYLNKYVKILGVKRKELARDLCIHETKFSKLINDKENPGLNILYRIEEHSDNVLKAELLWKIVARKIQYQIRNNKTDRSKESKKVKNKFVYEKM